MQRLIVLLGAVIAVLGSTSLVAESVALTPSRDNTIFSRDDDTSNALGILFTSANGQGNIRRALLAFDVAAEIPAGSTVTSATLTLTLEQGASASGDLDHDLHRLLQDWGEGTSFANSGNGAAATPGDATWVYRFFPDISWSTPGGEFVATPSARIAVGETPGPITWPSTPQMVADVQAWLDTPSNSYGWIILGSEDERGTARKFINRENPNPELRPMLTVEFTPPANADTAYFRVTKAFSDARQDEVEVTLTCNSGIPLEQSSTITGGGRGVRFVVSQLQGEDINCEITESDGPDGYSAIFNGGAGCNWEGVTAGSYDCAITNTAEPASFTVTKAWVIDDALRDRVELEAAVSVYCNNEIAGGSFNGAEYQYNGMLSGDGDSLTVSIDTTVRPAECRAEERIPQSSVESEHDCRMRTIPAGGSSSCTITNTVFFEGIPTLSETGLAILALLLSAVGILGLRRTA